jgi:hypothetical protein
MDDPLLKPPPPKKKIVLRRQEKQLHQVFKAGYKFYPDDLRFSNSLEQQLADMGSSVDKELKAEHIAVPLMILLKSIVTGGLSVAGDSKLKKELNHPYYELKWFWDSVFKQKSDFFLDSLFKNYLCKIKQSIEKNDTSTSGFIAGETLNLLLSHRSFTMEIILHTKSINQITLKNLSLFHFTLKRCFEYLDQYPPERKKKLTPSSNLPRIRGPQGMASNQRIQTEIAENNGEVSPLESLGVFRILLAETFVLLLETKGTAAVRSQIFLSTKETSIDIMVHWFLCFKYFLIILKFG